MSDERSKYYLVNSLTASFQSKNVIKENKLEKVNFIRVLASGFLLLQILNYKLLIYTRMIILLYYSIHYIIVLGNGKIV